MPLAFLVFAVSLLVLLVSARYFTSAAEKLGQAFGLSSFVSGIFIVGIGTSLPELVSGFVAASTGHTEIVAGNILGANISNIFLITGIIAILCKKGIDLGSQYIMIDLHFLIGSAFLIGLVMMDGDVNKTEAFFLLTAFLVYAYYLINSSKVNGGPQASISKSPFPYLSLLILIVSGVGIYFGADYTVNSITEIATWFSVPASLISLTILSLGTTLPELAVNISAIRKGKSEMAVGNVLGSCVFNALVIPGSVALYKTVAIPDFLIHFSLPVFVVASLFFYLLTQDKKISKWEGFLFLVFYGFFIAKVIM